MSQQIAPSTSPTPSDFLEEHSFLSVSCCDQLIALLNAKSTSDREKVYERCGGKRTEIPVADLLRQPAADTQLVQEIRSRIVERCGRFWAETQAPCSASGPLYPNFSLFSINRVGDSHSRHADNARLDHGKGEWVPNHTPYRILTALAYLNSCDSDFYGGEIYFPRINRAIKPSKGLLIASSSNGNWEHEVLTVTHGSRYVLAIWFTNDPAHREEPS